jgi:hypothetical protein
MFSSNNIRLKAAFIITLGILSTIIYTTSINAQNKEASTSLAHLQKFVGQYPSGSYDKNGDRLKGASLINDKAFRQVLMQALGKERFKTVISEFHVEIPIEQKGQILFFSRAMPHQANTDYAEIFINLSASFIEVCWANADSPDNLWISSKKPPRKVPKTPLMEVGQNSFGLFEKYGNH